MLVVRTVCFTPHKSEGEDWGCNNTFQSTCIIGGKLCRLVIDIGSFENIIAE